MAYRLTNSRKSNFATEPLQLPLPLVPGSWGKPEQGQPCTGCGHCCAVQPCIAAQYLWGDYFGPCDALRWQDGRWQCGLALFEQEAVQRGWLVKAVLPELLGFGTGCGVVMEAGGLPKDARWLDEFMARLQPLAMLLQEARAAAGKEVPA